MNKKLFSLLLVFFVSGVQITTATPNKFEKFVIGGSGVLVGWKTHDILQKKWKNSDIAVLSLLPTFFVYDATQALPYHANLALSSFVGLGSFLILKEIKADPASQKKLTLVRNQLKEKLNILKKGWSDITKQLIDTISDIKKSCFGSTPSKEEPFIDKTKELLSKVESKLK